MKTSKSTNSGSNSVETVVSSSASSPVRPPASSPRPPIDDILRKHNLSIDDLVKCGREGLLATKESNQFNEDGDRLEVPDYNVRHKYFDSFMNLLGYLKPSSLSVNVVQVSNEERELLEAYKRGAN